MTPIEAALAFIVALCVLGIAVAVGTFVVERLAEVDGSERVQERLASISKG